MKKKGRLVRKRCRKYKKTQKMTQKYRKAAKNEAKI